MLYLKQVFILLVALPFIIGSGLNADSILPDGSFETLNEANGYPSGWPTPGPFKWEVENGNRFLRLETANPGKMDTLYLKIDRPEKAEALELTLRARVPRLTVGDKPYYGVRVIINFLDAAETNLGTISPISFQRDMAEWEEYTKQFLIPEGTQYIEFMPSIFNAKDAVLDLDDITLTRTDPAPVREQVARNAPPPVPVFEVANLEKWPPELIIVENRIETTRGEQVWLQGVNLPAMSWLPDGEYTLNSVVTAIDEWNCNIVRLPVNDDFWYGKHESQSDSGRGYRAMVDQVIVLATNRGAYVILDLHKYRAPREEHLRFWRDVATKYSNHPGVLFDILNEAHNISWEVWRDGGFVSEEASALEDAFFQDEEERIQNLKGFQSPGMQKVIDVIRETGAKNIIVAGGLDYAYDLSGILQGYALTDNSGNGILYSTHVYPWKYDWKGKFLDVAEKYAVFIGEAGAANQLQTWQDPKSFTKPEDWYPDFFGLVQKHKFSWTAWSFHTQAGPRIIEDWKYTPTEHWGKPVKETLLGKQWDTENINFR